MKIFGAGLAGLIAANFWPEAKIYERNSYLKMNHKALLRFRTDRVGRAVGIEFRRVEVHKGIWYRNAYHQPNIRMSNWYSKKVTGLLRDRSIWNIDSVHRWVAPEDFIPQLIEKASNRIIWDYEITETDFKDGTIISTIPMPTTIQLLQYKRWVGPWDFKPIVVQRYRIPNSDVFQTVYFPDPGTKLYRASITGDLLIAEYMDWEDDYDLWSAFGIPRASAEKIDASKQSFGKIDPMDEDLRKAILHQFTIDHGVYSLGRFATWRNILLDDVLQDIEVIKKLMNSSLYEKTLKKLKK